MPADLVGRRRHRVVSIVGTRPEAIKMAPVVRALAAHGRIDQQIVLTGQHCGLAGYFDRPASEIRELPYDPRGRSASRLRETLHAVLCGQFAREGTDLVLVQGDTASAVAGAFAARDCSIPIGHVEAGLRSHDLNQPWPEEGNRLAIDALSDLLFAPTEAAAANLRSDWRATGLIHVTGNSGIDALLHTLRHLPPAPIQDEDGRKLILATCHRKENQVALPHICAAFKRLVAELPVRIALPLHPNRHARRSLEEALAGTGHIELLEPLDYEAMVALMARSWIILSDSGGFQEEGPALGKPVLVLRQVTERPEAVATGNIELVGTDPYRIVAAIGGLLADEDKYRRMAKPAFPFGDGRAGERIAATVGSWLGGRRRRAA